MLVAVLVAVILDMVEVLLQLLRIHHTWHLTLVMVPLVQYELFGDLVERFQQQTQEIYNGTFY